MSNPLISVITPIYNAEKFLLATLQSIAQQTHQNFESLLIIDSNSNDSSEIISRDFAAKDPRFRVVKVAREQGAGVTTNRNLGLQLAQGDYFCFLDSDDMWEPQKLEIQVEFMQKNSCRFSCTGYSKISQDGHRLQNYQKPYKKAYRIDILKNNLIGCLTVMIEKNLAKQVMFQNVMHEDLVFWLQVLQIEKVCMGIDLDLAKYRLVKGSRSNNKWIALRGRWNILRNIEKLSAIESIYYFSSYALHAILKY